MLRCRKPNPALSPASVVSVPSAAPSRPSSADASAPTATDGLRPCLHPAFHCCHCPNRQLTWASAYALPLPAALTQALTQALAQALTQALTQIFSRVLGRALSRALSRALAQLRSPASRPVATLTSQSVSASVPRILVLPSHSPASLSLPCAPAVRPRFSALAQHRYACPCALQASAWAWLRTASPAPVARAELPRSTPSSHRQPDPTAPADHRYAAGVCRRDCGDYVNFSANLRASHPCGCPASPSADRRHSF